MKKVLSRQTCDWFMFSVFLIAIFLEVTLSAFSYKESQIEEETKEVHFITDDEMSLLYLTKEDVNCDTCLVISQEDAERLMKIAVVEDFTSVESQANVMQVVLNRVNDPSFPNTIEGVIRQRGQFSTVSNGSYDRAKPDLNSHLALAMIEKGEVKTDALWFEASSAKNTWQSNNLVYVSTVGGTRFYR